MKKDLVVYHNLELKDGIPIILKKGMTWCIGDNSKNPHRSFTKNGALLFVVD